MSEKAMRYYCERKDNKWDEVDEFVYKNWDRVTTPKKDIEGNPTSEEEKRYTGNRFTVNEDGTVQMDMPQRVRGDVLGWIVRICGVSIPQGSMQGGFAPKPTDLLRIRPKGSKAKNPIIYDVRTKQKLRAI